MILILAEIIASILCVIWICGALYLLSKGKICRRFYHDILEWHLPSNEPQKFDGCNIHAKCKICGKSIMQDGQGNWF